MINAFVILLTILLIAFVSIILRKYRLNSFARQFVQSKSVSSSKPNLKQKTTTIFITGGTGTMGLISIQEILKIQTFNIHLKILARKSKKNELILSKILTECLHLENIEIEIIWGDLLNYDDIRQGISGADMVIHIGGLVTPSSDMYPYSTLKVNIESSRNIVKAINEEMKIREKKDDIIAVYVGSITENGSRMSPMHWARPGDPVCVSPYDHYGVSKAAAERIFVEGGLKKWVVIRMSSILHKGLLNHFEPVIFTVALNSTLEWCTLEDTGRMISHLVERSFIPDDVDMSINQDDGFSAGKYGKLPKAFWCKYYTVGSGSYYRLSNYEFMTLMFESLGLGPIEYYFEPQWFVTRNFHGHFILNDDVIENYLHYRENLPTRDYFKKLVDQCPFYFKIPRFVPCKRLLAFFIKPFMKHLASIRDVGTLDWIKTNDIDKINSYFGSIDAYRKISKDWNSYPINIFDKINGDSFKIPKEGQSTTQNEGYFMIEKEKWRKNYVYDDSLVILDHGYDETKPLDELTVNDLRQTAKFRGGSLTSFDDVTENTSKTITIDLSQKLEWLCGTCNKTFQATPNLILLGGHWCPNCTLPIHKWMYDEVAKTNPFFAQVWYNDHSKHESSIYDFDVCYQGKTYEKKNKENMLNIHFES